MKKEQESEREEREKKDIHAAIVAADAIYAAAEKRKIDMAKEISRKGKEITTRKTRY